MFIYIYIYINTGTRGDYNGREVVDNYPFNPRQSDIYSPAPPSSASFFSPFSTYFRFRRSEDLKNEKLKKKRPLSSHPFRSSISTFPCFHMRFPVALVSSAPRIPSICNGGQEIYCRIRALAKEATQLHPGLSRRPR